MATGYKDGMIKIWLVNDLQKRVEFNRFEFHEGAIQDIKFYYNIHAQEHIDLLNESTMTMNQYYCSQPMILMASSDDNKIVQITSLNE